MSNKKWIGDVLSRKPGALHQQLGISRDTKIPKTLLASIQGADAGDIIKNPTKTGHRRYKVTPLLKRRVNPVLTVRGFKRRRRGRIVY